ncbi:MAG TPA: CDP-archaeol synthase [Candidatus Saccharimonadales bacterium]|nr:CDP-archaeol synthase [Candidatus Saccharimonadales bacterium]
MGKDILFALWFFAPAGIANASPIFVSRFPGLKNLNTPMDFGATWRGKRLFGKNKTWRGLISGMVMATVTLALQQYAVRHFGWAQTLTRQIDYAKLPLFVVGPLLGAGALIGDAVESFFKRQREVPPGHAWFPFDQIDYVVGGAIAMLPFVRLHMWQYVWLVVVWIVLHLLASYVGFLLHLKERPI